ncbi:MAG: PorT family protein [Bacteroidales bacterium]|nr:PorT family protein [Bacteroidales bacterium]
MKKSFLLFCTIFFLIGAVSAQRSTTSSNFKGGLRVGFTTSQISADNLSGFHQYGACAGAFVNFPLTDNLRWKLQLEMDFTMKGSHSYVSARQQMQAGNPSYGKYALNLGYIEVPALFKWNFGQNLTIKGKHVLDDLELEFGPMFGVNLYQREKDMYGVIPGRPQFKRFELSAMAGLAAMFKEHHGISLRYSNSVLPVRNPDWQVNGYTKLQFNSVLMLSYYYQF